MTDEERIRRLVDGELNELEAAALLSDPALAAAAEGATQLAASMAALRADAGALPPLDFVDRSVRRAVLERARDEENTRGLAKALRSLLRPRAFRVRPVVLLFAAAATLLLALGGARWASGRDVGSMSAVREPRDAVPVRADPLASEIPVRFVLPATGAHSVVVAGDFNAWRTDATPLVDDDGDGVFVGTVSLAPGTYDYMFVVDGERWVADPYASQYRDDGFGQRNAVLRLN